MQRAIGGNPRSRAGATLEPEVAAALRLLNAMPDGDLSDLPVQQAREQIDHEAALFGGTGEPLATVEDLAVPAPHGSVPARLYRVRPEDSGRLLLYFHGGGWVLGSPDSHDAACRFLARHAGVTVLSLGHDPRRIAVGGDSAGGNLAAALCLGVGAD